MVVGRELVAVVVSALLHELENVRAFICGFDIAESRELVFVAEADFLLHHFALLLDDFFVRADLDEAQVQVRVHAPGEVAVRGADALDAGFVDATIFGVAVTTTV